EERRRILVAEHLRMLSGHPVGREKKQLAWVHAVDLSVAESKSKDEDGCSPSILPAKRIAGDTGVPSLMRCTNSSMASSNATLRSCGGRFTGAGVSILAARQRRGWPECDRCRSASRSLSLRPVR